MHVVATAGHVDHGKSTLVRALTGMEPDRWAEEQRRGMTIDLGFAWTTLPTGERLGFVDVPGHQRFLGNMLAGLGPAPAVLFVVAADEGWCRQSAEHLAAIDGLGLRHGLLAVTRCDLADPQPATDEAAAEIAGSSLGQVPSVAVSGVTGQGLPELRAALSTVLHRLPAPPADGPVRLWVDRAFTINGAGTVVTGTLTEGTLRVGDEVRFGERHATIRGLHTVGAPADRVTATARVAVNLRGVDRAEVSRGDALLTGTWTATASVDVRLDQDVTQEQLVLHLGTASVPVRVRRLSERLARLHLPVDLPLRAGDRGLLREPASQRVLTGLAVLDPSPPPLSRRGDAARRVRDLARPAEEPSGQGITELLELVDAHARQHPLNPWLPEAIARQHLGTLGGRLQELVTAAGLESEHGRIRRPGVVPDLGPVEEAVALIEKRLAADPFDSPDAQELGLAGKHLAAAQAAGRLLVLDGHPLLPGAPADAADRLRACDPPFTVAEARQALRARRPITVALLEHLDHIGVTHRLPGGVRELSAPRASAPSGS